MPVGISYNKGDWRVLMELTLKNEHCAVTVTDAGAMLRSLVRDGREYLWQGDPAYWAGQALTKIVKKYWLKVAVSGFSAWSITFNACWDSSCTKSIKIELTKLNLSL
jgi:hypothetical protein